MGASLKGLSMNNKGSGVAARVAGYIVGFMVGAAIANALKKDDSKFNLH